MKIEFSKMDETRTPEFKGGVGEYISKRYGDDHVKIMYGRLPVGASIGYHKHETNSETIYILEGEARCLYDDGEELLSKGDCHYCPKGHSHSLINAGAEDLVFFAVVPEHSALQDLKTRRSCRKYKPDQIKDEELEMILEAGTFAPTGMGRQSPIIVAVQDKETRDLLSKWNAEGMGANTDPFYGAPTVLVVLADRNVSTHVDDGNQVIGNLLNAAHAIGVDSCYVYRAREVFETEKGKELLRKWGIEGDYEGIGNVILGYGLPEGKKEAAQRKENYIVRV